MRSAPPQKPWSESCDQNREPILAVLRPLLADRRRLLEIGSGTGQHAVYFAPVFEQLLWQPIDVAENLPGINLWLDEARQPNIARPIALDVDGPWPNERFDSVFSANAVHIMGWTSVMALFAGVGRVLEDGGLLILYGPFNYDGHYTSASNARFDDWLKQRNPASGIRDFEALDSLAEAQGLQLIADHAMPANNRTLVWQRNTGTDND